MALMIIGFLFGAALAFLIGAALALRFNVFIIFPAIGLALLGTVAFGIADGDRIGSMVLTMVLIGTTLQVGYVAGIVTRAMLASIGLPNAGASQNLAYAGGQHSVSSFSMFKSLDVQDRMEVVGSDGKHVGTIDHKESADRIILAKDDPNAGGRPHLISIKWVDYVDVKIHLNKPSKKAMMEWQVAA
jgi:hypothetical protein